MDSVTHHFLLLLSSSKVRLCGELNFRVCHDIHTSESFEISLIELKSEGIRIETVAKPPAVARNHAVSLRFVLVLVLVLVHERKCSFAERVKEVIVVSLPAVHILV